MKVHWHHLVGCGAFICRAKTAFTQEWLDGIHQVLDQTDFNGPTGGSPTGGYPLSWAQIHGEIFHPLVYKYRDRVLKTLPMPVCSNYR